MKRIRISIGQLISFLPITLNITLQVSEYFPHLVLVHNKVEAGDFEDDVTDEIKEMYSLMLSKSRLNWKEEGTNNPNIVFIPDQAVLTH